MGVATGCGFKEIYRFPHTTCIGAYMNNRNNLKFSTDGMSFQLNTNMHNYILYIVYLKRCTIMYDR